MINLIRKCQPYYHHHLVTAGYIHPNVEEQLYRAVMVLRYYIDFRSIFVHLPGPRSISPKQTDCYHNSNCRRSGWRRPGSHVPALCFGEQHPRLQPPHLPRCHPWIHWTGKNEADRQVRTQCCAFHAHWSCLYLSRMCACGLWPIFPIFDTVLLCVNTSVKCETMPHLLNILIVCLHFASTPEGTPSFAVLSQHGNSRGIIFWSVGPAIRAEGWVDLAWQLNTTGVHKSKKNTKWEGVEAVRLNRSEVQKTNRYKHLIYVSKKLISTVYFYAWKDY